MNGDTNMGGKCTIYTANNPAPPWSESEDCKTLERAISLLQNPNEDVARLASIIVKLCHDAEREGSTVARCSIAQGIVETERRIQDALAGC